MEDSALIEALQEKVREAEELLRRRRDALAALKGKSGPASRSKKARGLREGSVPALAQAALKTHKLLTLDELAALLKKSNPDIEARSISLALSKYVRNGKYFEINEEGKYGLR
jgi:hypothetical protein